MSKRKLFSQREALMLQRRVRKLENHLEMQRRQWTDDWPKRCIFIGRVEAVANKNIGAVETAIKLKHAVVCSVDGDALTLWADPVPAPYEVGRSK